MATVINQADDNEVDVLDSAKLTAMYGQYKRKVGAFPFADEELSIEQVTSLFELFRMGRPPYTDFAIWGPYHHRIQKKLKAKGLELRRRTRSLPLKFRVHLLLRHGGSAMLCSRPGQS